MTVLTMPSFGADMESGQLNEWLVAPGDEVKKGDVVAVIETMKGLIDMEVFEEGKVEALLVSPGDQVPVGEPIARLVAEGEILHPQVESSAIEAIKDKQQTPAIEKAPEVVAEEVPEIAPKIAPEVEKVSQDAVGSVRSPNIGQKITPAARFFAAENAVELTKVVGSGSQGEIRLADVKQRTPTATKPTEKKSTGKKPGTPMEAMRQAIALAMAKSKREIPHYYLHHDIDLTRAKSWLDQLNETLPSESPVLLAAVLLKAVAKTLKKFPELNGFYQGDEFVPAKQINIGHAVFIRGGGLISPAILNTDKFALLDLMTHLKDLVDRARNGGLKSSEMTEATITLSSLGDRGVDDVTGVIYPPQVAIVGLGTPKLKPSVVDGKLEPRLIVSASLAGDHRVTDGHYGGRFLLALEKLLQKPEKLGD